MRKCPQRAAAPRVPTLQCQSVAGRKSQGFRPHCFRREEEKVRLPCAAYLSRKKAPFEGTDAAVWVPGEKNHPAKVRAGRDERYRFSDTPLVSIQGVKLDLGARTSGAPKVSR